MTPTLELAIEVQLATEAPSLADEFTEKHLAVLAPFGVRTFSAYERLRDRTGSVLFVARVRSTGEAIAGIRLDAAIAGAPLPTELALRTADPAAADWLGAISTPGTSEICALWVTAAFTKIGLPLILVRACVAAAPALRMARIIAFPHQRTRPLFPRFGWRVVERVGERGEFRYPTPDYVSTVMLLDDAAQGAAADERERLLQIRTRDGATLTSLGPAGGVSTSYPGLPQGLRAGRPRGGSYSSPAWGQK